MVSVIIPTFNRFDYLLNTIDSVKDQTYSNLEIIVVNDGSTQEEYYSHDFGEFVNIIHLPNNSRSVFGFACTGYVRNAGIQAATGKYIALCDDDDIWFPDKLELQISAMEKLECKMSSTEGLIGNGIYDSEIHYKKYNAEHFYSTLQNIYRGKGSDLLDNGFPDVWDFNFLKIHNCIICSSVVIEKSILDKINNFRHMKPPGEDYDCWLRALRHTNCAYVKDVCFYYDDAHGEGSTWT
jgi:glycosyltransferase involved in cell wall biosynthesis